MEILIFAVIFWLIPIFVAHAIGKPKHRAGFLYGLVLGWIGVIIVALLPAVPEMTLEQVERHKVAMGPHRYAQAKAELQSKQTRECPHCKEQMRRDAGVCPHCRHESPAWTLHEGRWWVQTDDEWYWLDEAANEWKRSQAAEAVTS